MGSVDFAGEDVGLTPAQLREIDQFAESVPREDLIAAMEHYKARAAELEAVLYDHSAPLTALCERFGLRGRRAELFCVLFKAKGMRSNERLHYALYGDDPSAPELKIIDVFVCHLRKVLADSDYEVRTVWGEGYILDGPRDLETAPSAAVPPPDHDFSVYGQALLALLRRADGPVSPQTLSKSGVPMGRLGPALAELREAGLPVVSVADGYVLDVKEGGDGAH